jgi:hypothetical protein
MNGAEYAAKKNLIAGQIRGALSVVVPHPQECQAYAVHQAMAQFQADSMEVDAEFLGNGMTADIAKRVSDQIRTELHRGGSGKQYKKAVGVEWTPTAVYRTVLTVLVILSALISFVRGGGKLDVAELRRAGVIVIDETPTNGVARGNP